MSKKKRTLNASWLRIVLSVLLLTVIIGSASAFSYAIQQIKSYAIDVSHKKVDAVASNGNLQTLMTTQQELDQNRDVLEKIGLLKSSSQFPEFQVVDEVRSIATKNNIQIESFTYGATAATQTPSGSTTTPAPPAANTAASGNTIALTVALSSASYLDFLQFTYDIEQHLPKMKIQGIDMTASNNGGAAIGPLVVEMYIK
ncbi:MAG: hypothetical protein JWO61_333 [Candidatus Saccharibacteria bacterium]|nr:hypothetical protein [Candidatus Saccharibacteria bacterium]